MTNIIVTVNTVTFAAYPRPFWTGVNTGQWEPHTFNAFKRHLDKNHSMIDIGAWIGPTTLYGAHLAKHVYAFEPDPVAFDELRYNVHVNPALKPNIDICQMCISDKCGPASIGTQSEFGDSMSSLLFGDGNKTVATKCITLQGYFKFKNITDCNFVKMDIEGGEVIVLPHIVDFLIESNITLFVSMHPFWFKDLFMDTGKILLTLEKFPFLQDCTGQTLTLDIISKVLMAKQGIDVLCGHNLKPTPDVT
jgi:FkbM family methyltransferase